MINWFDKLPKKWKISLISCFWMFELGFFIVILVLPISSLLIGLIIGFSAFELIVVVWGISGNLVKQSKIRKTKLKQL